MMIRCVCVLVFVGMASGLAQAKVLNPLAFTSQGTLDTSSAVTIDTDAMTLSFGSTTFNGVLASDGSVAYVFNSIDLTGTVAVTGDSPFQLLSQSNLTINSTIDISASGQSIVVAGGQVGGAGGRSGAFAESGSPLGLGGTGGGNASSFNNSSGRSGGGGGFGGDGGNGGNGGGNGGDSISAANLANDLTLPLAGSGGGGGLFTTPGDVDGGAGGGSGGVAGFGGVGTVTLAGSYLADGGNQTGSSGSGARGGGGAGGGFLIYGGSVDLTGATISAEGGSGGSSGGVGGGGIVYVEGVDLTNAAPNSINVSRGSNGRTNGSSGGEFASVQVAATDVNGVLLLSDALLDTSRRPYQPWRLNAGSLFVNDTGASLLAPIEFSGGRYVSPERIRDDDLPGGINGFGEVLAEIGGNEFNPITINATGGNLTIGDSTLSTGVRIHKNSSMHVHGVLVTMLDIDQVVVQGSVTLEDGSRLAAANGMQITQFGQLDANGNAVIGDAFKNNGIVNGPTGAGEWLTFTGPVEGDGSFTGNTAFAGGLSIGNSPAQVSFENISLAALNTTTIELGGLAAGTQHDQIVATGTFHADGTLDIVLIDSFVPAIGDSFTIFAAASFTGAFSEINLPGLLDEQAAWDTSDLLVDGTLHVVPEPASFALLGLGALLAHRQRRN